ncbi:MAG: hypothetical protein WDZ67_01875 [Patescibacteria group bacterium]
MAHERNATEKAIILALAFRAGLASTEGDEFLVEPATLDLDRHSGFDLILYRIRSGFRKWLLVDATSSRREMGKKIARSISKKRALRYILKGDWQTAVFDIAIDSCFQKALDRLSDGKPMAFREACPDHGNQCRLAHRLFEFSEILNRQLASHRRKDGSPGDATRFVMNVPKPPF